MNTLRDNAFLPFPDAPMARTSEIGPLSGLRLAVKDIYDVEGYPTGAGNAFVLASSGIKSKTAPIVRNLMRAGAEFVGKTYTDELAYSLTGLNMHFGSPRNPLDDTWLSGGSSSGSAVAVAEGFADIGLGSDTSGSIRLPATINGCIGWRPTHGAFPMHGCRPLAPSFDTVGFVVANLDVLDRLMEICPIGAQPCDLDAPILVPEDVLAVCDGEIVDRFVGGLDRQGIDYRFVPRISRIALDDALRAFTTILWYEAWQSNRDLLMRRPDSIDPSIRDRLTQGLAITPSHLEEARSVKEGFQRDLEELFEPGAIIAFPTLPIVPPRRDAARDELDTFRGRVLLINCIASLSGRPQLTLPKGGSLRMSFEVSLITSRQGDRNLSAKARALQGSTLREREGKNVNAG